MQVQLSIWWGFVPESPVLDVPSQSGWSGPDLDESSQQWTGASSLEEIVAKVSLLLKQTVINILLFLCSRINEVVFIFISIERNNVESCWSNRSKQYHGTHSSSDRDPRTVRLLALFHCQLEWSSSGIIVVDPWVPVFRHTISQRLNHPIIRCSYHLL